MKHGFALLGATLVLWLAAGCATTGGYPAERTMIGAKDKVSPALVHIRPVREVFTAGRREEMPAVGSGFIISPDGYVVTNEHVAGDASVVKCVLYDRTEMDAEVVGVDRFTDIAVLKLKTGRDDLPVARFGESKNVQSGQTVLALGSPHGLARSVSMGIISVTDRHLPDRGDMVAPYNNWIQTDAAINPGNSGGPLINLRGEVIGVNARRLGGADNVGFAIPGDTAREVVEEIIEHGQVSRSWLGLTFQPMRSRTDDPTQEGVVIADVDPLSPASEARLAAAGGGEAGHAVQFMPGDVLLAINGEPVNARFEEDLPAVRQRIARLPVGSEVTARVQRGGEEFELVATTAELSDLRGAQVAFPEWGFTGIDMTPELARRAQLPAAQGLLVSGVQVGGVADNAGLQQTDIILTVDEEPVESLADFQEKYRERLETGQRLVLLEVRSGALFRYVLVRQDGAPAEAPPDDIMVPGMPGDGVPGMPEEGPPGIPDDGELNRVE